ncbi:MAG: hypothetical protein KDI36_02785 [Pseudomonadales bacterium]|nr:hypothetical protein [Pseudomonadales bacterium]
MKRHLITALTGSLLFATAATAADKDFSRVIRDIEVMSEVLKGAFKAESDCDYCRVNIETRYLASQGAVFTITAPRGFAFRFNTSEFEVPSPEELHIVREFERVEELNEIPELVGDALRNINISVDGLEDMLVTVTSDAYSWTDDDHSDRDIRESLRDLRREQREVEREMREMELELIHVEDDAQRRDINNSIKDLQKKLTEREAKVAQLKAQIDEKREAREQQRQAAQAKLAEAEAERIKQMQAVAIRSFCDYGATLRNLPDDEYVSLVFDRAGKEQDARVYVMPRDAIADCRSPEDLLKKAITYPL